MFLLIFLHVYIEKVKCDSDMVQDQRDSTTGRALALQLFDSGLIPFIPYGPLSTIRSAEPGKSSDIVNPPNINNQTWVMYVFKRTCFQKWVTKAKLFIHALFFNAVWFYHYSLETGDVTTFWVASGSCPLFLHLRLKGHQGFWNLVP